MIKWLGDDVQVLQPKQASFGLRGHLWEQFTLPGQLPNGALLWSLANTGPLRVANQVLTLHDVSVLEHPEWFTSGFAAWYRFLLPRLAKRVHNIITVSEFSKGRILKMLGVREDKIVVIPNGVDHEVFHPRTRPDIDAAKRKFGLKGDYVISVGALQPRKNLKRLFEAWNQTMDKYPGIDLVVVGVEDQVFRNRGFVEVPPKVHLLGQVPDADLATLYSGAKACVQLSVYEGFNLPVVEAMACGTAVLAAKTTSTPEVVGDAGILFDPLSAHEIGEALHSVFADGDLAHNLSERGLVQAKKFSWQNAAKAALTTLNASQ